MSSQSRQSNKSKKLYEAIKDEDVDAVKRLIAAGVLVNNKLKEDFCTPLYRSCAKNTVEIVEILLDAGANVNDTRNNNRGTALQASCYGDNVEIVKTLIAHGADPNPIDAFGNQPLFTAATNGRNATVEFLLSIENIDVNGGKQKGSTPLHWSVHNGHDYCTLALLAAGANTNIMNRSGTPLHWANNASPRVLLALLKHGADANAINKAGETPLGKVLPRGPAIHVAILLHYGASCSLPTKFWFQYVKPAEVPLVIASLHNKRNQVYYLLRHSLKHSHDCVPLKGDVYKYQSDMFARLFRL